jgi:hypothetical protein
LRYTQPPPGARDWDRLWTRVWVVVLVLVVAGLILTACSPAEEAPLAPLASEAEACPVPCVALPDSTGELEVYCGDDCNGDGIPDALEEVE